MRLKEIAFIIRDSAAALPAEPQGWLPYVTGAGGALVVLAVGLYFFFINKLHSDGEFQGAVKERDRAYDDRDRALDALDNEKEAHQKTRDALAVANARADQGIRSAEIIATALQLQGKKG